MQTVHRRIHDPASWLDILYRATDAGCILAALWASIGSTQFVSGHDHWLAGAVAVIVFYLVAEVSGIYRNWRGSSINGEVLCALLTWLYSLPVLLAFRFFTGYSEQLPHPQAVMWLATAPCLLAACRVLVRWTQRSLRTHGFNTRGFAIFGISELGFQLARNIESSAGMGLKLVGFYDDRNDERIPDVPKDIGVHIGNVDELVEEARAGRVSMIYIALPLRAEDRIRNVLKQLSDTTASVYLVPDFFVYELLHSRWTNIDGMPVVSVFEHPFYGVDGLLKRVVDLGVATAALVALAIPMSIIAALIKLSSPGPVFFRQRRYGLDGREIKVWKFRSMTVCEDGNRVQQAQKNDSRVTRIGAILRGTSLDELPQLFNVLGGSMSLVGPRPHANAHNEEYRQLIDGYMLRHKVKPGITGLAQVNGWRGETDTLEKMEGRVACDHRYIREWSLLMDIKILFQTFFVVFSRKNAY
jgi:putative colanic acid biosynthesis UDP-glucose lipid carrier transferase